MISDLSEKSNFIRKLAKSLSIIIYKKKTFSQKRDIYNILFSNFWINSIVKSFNVFLLSNH